MFFKENILIYIMYELTKDNIEKEVKKKTLGELINNMIELVISRDKNSDKALDKILYQSYLDEINLREKYFKAGASVMFKRR